MSQTAMFASTLGTPAPAQGPPAAMEYGHLRIAAVIGKYRTICVRVK